MIFFPIKRLFKVGYNNFFGIKHPQAPDCFVLIFFLIFYFLFLMLGANTPKTEKIN